MQSKTERERERKGEKDSRSTVKIDEQKKEIATPTPRREADRENGGRGI